MHLVICRILSGRLIGNLFEAYDPAISDQIRLSRLPVI
jgi:hypothetical protein